MKRPGLFRNRKVVIGLLIVVSMVILASEVGGYYFFQNTYLKRSSAQNGGNSSRTGPATNPNTISVSTLINYGNSTRIWYNESDVTTGSSFYDLTFKIARGNVAAIYYSSLNAHFITGINGVTSDGSGSNCNYCWGIWIYCTKDIAWMYSILGADLIKLRNDDVLAWYIQNVSQNLPPEPGAKTVTTCSE